MTLNGEVSCLAAVSGDEVSFATVKMTLADGVDDKLCPLLVHLSRVLHDLQRVSRLSSFLIKLSRLWS